MAIKNILVPTDLSEISVDALDLAAQIGAICNGSVITLLYAIDLPYYKKTASQVFAGSPHDEIGYNRNLDILAEIENIPQISYYINETKKSLEALKSRHNNVTIKINLVFDSLRNELSKINIEDQTDLIVIGCEEGNTNFFDLFSLAKAPLLSINKRIDSFKPKKIAFVSKFENISERAISLLKNFQNLYSAEVHLLKIISPNYFESTANTFSSLKYFIFQHDLVQCKARFYNHSSFYEGIKEYTEFNEIDMVCMLSSGKKESSKVHFGNKAKVTNQLLSIPVLTLNNHF